MMMIQSVPCCNRNWDAGYIIEEARNGKEALESVRKNRPDLIILDMMMPEMNGFDVAAVIKE